MALKKIDFKLIATKSAGAAMGTMAAGFVLGAINKITNSEGQPALNDVMQGVTLMAVGALAPDFIGKKNPMIEAAGIAVMTKGTDKLLRKYFPSAIQGVDNDAVMGYGDYEEVSGTSINDYNLEEPGIIQGTESYDGRETVSGSSSTI